MSATTVARVTSPLHDQPLLPHLIVRSLAAHDDAPCIHLAGRVATYARGPPPDEPADPGSTRSRGVTRGTRLAVLSKNRPEVLTNLTASLVNGCVVTPLHPMGSLADHAYVIGDAEIECLVFDADNFTDRARELKAQYPNLTLLGFGPNDVGDDYLALADEFEPAPLDAPDVGPEDLCTIVYTGGTTGRPKGVLMTTSCVAGDDVDPDGRVGVPRRPADRDRDAAVACRDVARRARAAVGRSVLRDGVVQPGRLLRPRRRASHHGDADRPRHVVRAAGPSAVRRRPTCRRWRPSSTGRRR